MFVVNFRIPLGFIAGTNIFLNGSAASTKRVPKGARIMVRSASGTGDFYTTAEVIESNSKGLRTPAFKWVLSDT